MGEASRPVEAEIPAEHPESVECARLGLSSQVSDHNLPTINEAGELSISPISTELT